MLAASLAIFALVSFLCRERVYSGRPVSWWLDKNQPKSPELIQLLDTNIVPDLVARLKSTDWKYRARMVTLARRHMFLAPILRRVIGLSAWQKQLQALDLLSLMGAAARPALPTVFALLSSNSIYTGHEIVKDGLGMGVTEDEARSLLRMWMALPEARANSFAVTSILNRNGCDTAMALLISSELARQDDATILRAIVEYWNLTRPTSTEIAPVLAPLLDDPRIYMRRTAWGSFAVQSSTNSLPILARQLFASDPEIVSESASRIGRFKGLAAESVPQLWVLTKDVNLSVRIAAVGALREIDPSTPATASDVDLRFEYPLVAVAQADDSGDPIAAATPIEKADIAYNFVSLPVQSALGIYEGLAGKKVALPPSGLPQEMISVRTSFQLTKSQAMELFEELFSQQAHVEIRHGADGSLSAVCTNVPAVKTKQPRPPGFALPPPRPVKPATNAAPASGEKG